MEALPSEEPGGFAPSPQGFSSASGRGAISHQGSPISPGAAAPPVQPQLLLRLAHACRHQGCHSAACALCRHNVHKCCDEDSMLEACAAQGRPLEAHCGAELFLELVDARTGARVEGSQGLGAQVCVVDGRSCRRSGGPGATEHARELLRSDDGHWLLEGCSGSMPHARDGHGRLLLPLQDGVCRLSGLCIMDKTDTFRMDGQSFSSFRLLARAVRLDQGMGPNGEAPVLPEVEPAVSTKFMVKSLRALEGLTRPDYVHYKESVTRLKYTTNAVADALWNIQLHVPEIPFSSIQTVEHMAQLIWYTDHHWHLQGKVLDLLNMNGQHRHKWDYLRTFLAERVVHDDDLHRAWFTDETRMQGLLFACNQGQINMEAPLGVVERHLVQGQLRLQVSGIASGAFSVEAVEACRRQAVEAWAMPGHQGWAVVNEPLDLVGGPSSTPPQHAPSPRTRLQPASSPRSVQTAAGNLEHQQDVTPASHPARRSLCTAFGQQQQQQDADFPANRANSFFVPSPSLSGARAAAPCPADSGDCLSLGAEGMQYEDNSHYLEGGGGGLLSSPPQTKRQRVSAQQGEVPEPLSRSSLASISESDAPPELDCLLRRVSHDHGTAAAAAAQQQQQQLLPPRGSAPRAGGGHPPRPAAPPAGRGGRAVSFTGSGPERTSSERSAVPGGLLARRAGRSSSGSGSGTAAVPPPRWAERLSAPMYLGDAGTTAAATPTAMEASEEQRELLPDSELAQLLSSVLGDASPFSLFAEQQVPFSPAVACAPPTVPGVAGPPFGWQQQQQQQQLGSGASTMYHHHHSSGPLRSPGGAAAATHAAASAAAGPASQPSLRHSFSAAASYGHFSFAPSAATAFGSLAAPLVGASDVASPLHAAAASAPAADFPFIGDPDADSDML